MKAEVLRTNQQVVDVANEIGEFIEYWGFKKIHGKIWSLIFLAEEPVDSRYLIENLGVSKALISMSIKDLVEYNVILESPEKKSTVHYISNPDLSGVILDVLLGREAKMLLRIKNSCELLARVDSSETVPKATQKRISQLKKMIRSADTALKTLITLKQLNFKDLSKTLNLTK